MTFKKGELVMCTCGCGIIGKIINKQIRESYSGYEVHIIDSYNQVDFFYEEEIVSIKHYNTKLGKILYGSK